MTRTILDLGQQPLVNNLCKDEASSLNAAQFSLEAIVEDDLTIHLSHAVDPSVLYGNYLYHSATSTPYVEHCREMFKSFEHLRHDVIIDIGGNDGSLLKAFKQSSKNHMLLINVDASPTFKEKNEDAEIVFINDFWGDHLDLPKANIITSTNVFQHTKDIHAFLRGIQKFLDGVWILEFPYAAQTILTEQFDQFYHEHYYYWLLTPLETLFEQYGLRIIHLQQEPIHGGTMRLWMTNKVLGAPTLDLYHWKEYEQGLMEEALLGSNIKSLTDQLASMVANDEEFGQIAFFGAAAKGCVFLNALKANCKSMGPSFVVDDTKSKQGLYMPGTGFPVVDRSHLPQCNTIIILAHNFADHIAESLRKDGFKGRIVAMLPLFREFD